MIIVFDLLPAKVTEGQSTTIHVTAGSRSFVVATDQPGRAARVRWFLERRTNFAITNAEILPVVLEVALSLPLDALSRCSGDAWRIDSVSTDEATQMPSLFDFVMTGPDGMLRGTVLGGDEIVDYFSGLMQLADGETAVDLGDIPLISHVEIGRTEIDVAEFSDAPEARRFDHGSINGCR